MDTEMFICHGATAITCVETHTVGMPARIITKGYPLLEGTLISQKAEAARSYDAIRKRVILEPRGHSDMFGAILRPQTELTESGEAHMGVLYMHGKGYSNMCGHATLAVCRLLIDTHDSEVFPNRHLVQFDPSTQTSRINLHTLGGLIEATVPTSPDGRRSDPTRPVGIRMPAYVTATNLTVTIPPKHKWPQLGNRVTLRVSLAYGSAFSCQVELEELGFPADTLSGKIPFEELKHATAQLKQALSAPIYEKFLKNPVNGALGAVFGVMVVAKGLGQKSEGAKGVETGLYIFADGLLDRSPTGSAAAARNAVLFATEELAIGESWTYHSLISNKFGKDKGFDARIIHGGERWLLDEGGYAAGPIKVEVKGYPYYTGFHSFVVEQNDFLGDNGFSIDLE